MKIARLGDFRTLTMAVTFGALALGGCGDDGGAGSGDGTTEGSTGGTATDTSATMTNMTTPTSDGSISGSGDTTGDPSGSSSGGGESSSGGPTQVTLSGEVENLVFMTGVPDAEVSVLGMPGFEATADADGAFEIAPIDPNQNIIFEVAPSTDFVGSYIPYAVEDEDDDGVRLGQIERTFLETQEGLIMKQGAAPFDPTLSIVIVRLVSTTALMDGALTVEMTPAPAADTFYAPDAGGMPILNSADITFGLIPVVVYFNVPISQPGDLSFSFTHPTDTCSTVFTDFPTAEDHITLVDVQCM